MLNFAFPLHRILSIVFAKEAAAERRGQCNEGGVLQAASLLLSEFFFRELGKEFATRQQEMKCERILHAFSDVSKRLQQIEAIPLLLVSGHRFLQLQGLAQLLLNETVRATREAFFRR
jgi:hypothetical protein